MFGPPGHAYVFLIYGMYRCLNVVTGADGEAGAVLLRAAAPLAGLDLMRRRRGRPHDADHRLASGPGRLGSAFGVERHHSGADMTAGPLRLLAADALAPDGSAESGAPGASEAIVAGPRIGVTYAGEPWVSLPWRFHLGGDPSVSR